MKSNRISGLTYLKEEKSMKKRILSGLLALCLALVLMPTAANAAKSDVSAGAETYYDIVSNANKRVAITSAGTRMGMLADLNGDGFEELILMYFTMKDVPFNGSIDYLVCSVYTKQANKVVPLMEEYEIYPDAGGPHAEVGTAVVNGKTCFAIMESGTNPTGPEPGDKYTSSESWKFFSYDGQSLNPCGEASSSRTFIYNSKVEDTLVSSSCSVLGQSVTYADFESWRNSLSRKLMVPYKQASGTSFSTLMSKFKENEPMQQPTLGNFYDVPVGAYYYDAVKWAIENNITSGISETQFGPENTCTRAQAVTFLWKAAGSPEPKDSQNSFTDVPNDYYTKAVLWAVEQGIINGYEDNSFRPNGSCDRGMIVTMLWRAAGKPTAAGGSGFNDVADGAWYSDAVKWAASKGISVGNGDGTFTPASLCTRGMIVTFLHRDRTAK